MQNFSDMGIGGGLNLPAGFDESDGVERADWAGLVATETSVEVVGFDTIESAEYPGKPFCVLAIKIDGEKFTTGTGSSVIHDQLSKAAARQDVDGNCTGFPFRAVIQEKPGKGSNKFFTFA